MENYLNILHFCFYKSHFKSYILFNRISPIRLLSEIPIVKKRLKDKGVDNIEQLINRSVSNKYFGLSITVAGGILWGGLSILLFSVAILINIVNPSIIACGIISGILAYFFVFKNNKYIKYFDRYEKQTISEIQIYYWLTLASVAVVFFLVYLSFKK